MIKRTVKLFIVGNNWYYTVDKWKGTTGPFASLLEASEALTHELENMNGKEERGYTTQDLSSKEES